MKLLTNDLKKKLPKLYATEDVPLEEKEVIVKFFSPVGSATWYAIEFDPEEKLFFGYVSIWGDHNDEFGYFSLDELKSIQLPFGLHIERDLYFKPTKIKDLISNY